MRREEWRLRGNVEEWKGEMRGSKMLFDKNTVRLFNSLA